MIGRQEYAIQLLSNVRLDGVIIIIIVVPVFVLDLLLGINLEIVLRRYVPLNVVVDFGLIPLLAQGSVCLFVPVVMILMEMSQATIPLGKTRQGDAFLNVPLLQPLQIGKRIFASADALEILQVQYQLILIHKLKDVLLHTHALKFQINYLATIVLENVVQLAFSTLP